ncbi:hypothetical protein ANN_05121 [Periplaneta americana]|uniref:Uncharacterized protein n=1 Tax=Periplaneta americana TaxID=6978 RepID=A0ABQ8TC36_PERAM|nr:hypothetical protein ANN_05121 [Periplaneta americana]
MLAQSRNYGMALAPLLNGKQTGFLAATRVWETDSPYRGNPCKACSRVCRRALRCAAVDTRGSRQLRTHPNNRESKCATDSFPNIKTLTEIGGQSLVTKRCEYLGCTISSNMSCCQEVKRRIAMAKEAFNRKRNIFCETLEKELRKRLLKCFGWSVSLCESINMDIMAK